MNQKKNDEDGKKWQKVWIFMSDPISLLAKPKVALPLDEHFLPAVLWDHAFSELVRSSGGGLPLAIGLKRNDGPVSVFKTQIFPPGHTLASLNRLYAERLVKSLLWLRGGYQLTIAGDSKIGQFIKEIYSSGGKRAFDAAFMANIYEKPFSVVIGKMKKIPTAEEKSIPLGGHLEGCRIGFDLGASDRKVSAVIDGKTVFSEEVVWNPRDQDDPDYHYREIRSMLRRAAAHLPRVDAIGGSSAGIYIDNRVMTASIFRGIPPELFEKRVKHIFLEIQKEEGVPLEIINDGEVTALAGSMSLETDSVLGIAMGSSEAGGYINKDGNVTGWLNELAFVPIDFYTEAPVDEWSADRGCGVQYLSQIAVIRLAEKAGIVFSREQTPGEKLKFVQGLMGKGDERAKKIFETIGGYLGYGIAYYADFYAIKHVLILGRVTSGEGGQIILQKAEQVLKEKFPALYQAIKLHLPDESTRRVGQSIAAASLPALRESEKPGRKREQKDERK